MEEKNIDVFKPKKSNLIVTIVLVLVIIISLVVGYQIVQKKEKEVVAFSTIFTSKDSANKYVSVKIAGLPYLFAERDTDSGTERYYIVYDQNDYLYIARISNSEYGKIEAAYEKNRENFSYEIKGTTSYIVSDLKRLAIETYEENLEDSFLTATNFEEYFGKTYLDTTKTPTSDIFSIIIMVDVIIFIFVIAFGINYLTEKIKIKKVLKKYDEQEVNSALLSSDTIKFPKAKIYLTNKYLVSTASGLEIIPYDNIYWTYKLTRKYNGVTVGRNLLALTKDKKKRTIANIYNDQVLEEIIHHIWEKNKDILVGYTTDNIRAYRKLPKIKEDKR